MSDATAAQVDTQHTPDLKAMQRRINELHSDLAKVAQGYGLPTRIMCPVTPHSE